MAADPCELIHEQKSKGQALGNSVAEGAVEEVKAKMRTLPQ